MVMINYYGWLTYKIIRSRALMWVLKSMENYTTSNKLVWSAERSNYSDCHQLTYYHVKNLKGNNPKPIFPCKNQFNGYCIQGACNNHSKFWLYSNNSQQTAEFFYFDLKNNPQRKLRNSVKKLTINEYGLIIVWEVGRDIQLLIYKTNNTKNAMNT